MVQKKKKKKLIVRLFCLSLRNQNLSVSSFHLIEVAGQILCSCSELKGRILTPSNNVPSHSEEQRGMSKLDEEEAITPHQPFLN